MLRFRAVQLRIVTTGPICGVDLRFENGLNILRADNSSGKSTCLQAMLYALGLEGMLSPRREVPLPHAMTDEIEIGGRSFSVERSFVRVEVENAAGEVITIRRSIRGASEDSRLITVISGPAITRGAGYERRDYFVRMPGAAQRDAGFHQFLAKFVGWHLPRVSKTDGSEAPLYVECLFPYHFVEQKQGWLGVQPRIPTYFQIRDIVRRTAEFVLGLDAYELALKRQRLDAAQSIVEAEWNQLSRRLQEMAISSSVVLQGLPRRPSHGSESVVEALIPVGQGNWHSLDSEISRLRQGLEDLGDTPQVVRASSEDLELELSSVHDALTDNHAEIVDAIRQRDSAAARLASLFERVVALREDLQRHKDSLTLTRLGSKQFDILGDEPQCPTCSQLLPDGFDITAIPMSAEENVAYLQQELATFESMLIDSERSVEVGEAKLGRLRAAGSELRSRVRAIKDSLTSPSSMPSIASVAARIHAEEKIGSLENFRREFGRSLAELDSKTEEWRRVRASRLDIGADHLSGQDRAKLDFLGASFGAQLVQYRFRSLDPEKIAISDDTYRPVHEGFDLGFDLSASDMVRAMWAYLLAFAETSIEFPTNHLGLLVLDEPRQQEVHRRDFAAFLKRLAEAGRAGLQVIVATSEDHDSLVGILKEAAIPFAIESFPQGRKILAPIEP